MNDIIQQKQKLVNEIYINTREQGDCIGKIDDEKLNKLLDKREILINNVIELQKKIDAVSLSTQDIQDLNDIDIQIRRIQQLEQINSEALKRLQQRIKNDIEDNKKDIKKLNLSSKAIISGYFGYSSQSNGYFIDKKQ